MLPDHIERDNADVILIVPAWTQQTWWRRLTSGAWRARVLEWLQLPPRCFVANNDHVFFGTGGFVGTAWALRIVPLRAL